MMRLVVLFASVAFTQAGDCHCKGLSATEGVCGYHIQNGNASPSPWCRTLNNCGKTSVFGSWDYCDDRSVEHRHDVGDGELYTSKQFQQFYGSAGGSKWKEAEPLVERRIANDHVAYTVHEFEEYYNSLDQWLAAAAEQRKAVDGAWYTYADFFRYYGAQAPKKWIAAKPAQASATMAKVTTPNPPAATKVTVVDLKIDCIKDGCTEHNWMGQCTACSKGCYLDYDSSKGYFCEDNDANQCATRDLTRANDCYWEGCTTRNSAGECTACCSGCQLVLDTVYGHSCTENGAELI